MRHPLQNTNSPRYFYQKHQEISNIDYYLDVLTTKPGALTHAKPVNDESLSEAYQILREKEKMSSNDFIQVLKLHREFPSHLVDEAVKLALVYQVYHYEGIKNLVIQLMTPEVKHAPLSISEQSEWNKVVVQKPQLSQFNQLLERRC